MVANPTCLLNQEHALLLQGTTNNRVPHRVLCLRSSLFLGRYKFDDAASSTTLEVRHRCGCLVCKCPVIEYVGQEVAGSYCMSPTALGG